MNMFTLAQLVNHTIGTTYYDTKSGGIKYSPSPNLTMFGYDSYDTTLIKGKKTENINKDNHLYLLTFQMPIINFKFI